MEHEHHHTIADTDANQRIDKFLATDEFITSRAEVQRLLKSGDITVNQLCVNPSYKLRAGDLVRIVLPEPELLDLVPEQGPLDILYEDANLLVINKAAGVVVHPAPGHNSGTLVHFLMHHCKDLAGIGGVQRPGIVHRLDKDTSGTLVVAKNDIAHQSLVEQFKVHSIHRQYIALVWGVPMMSSGTISAAIGRNPNNRKKMGLNERGKHAVTHWRVLERFQNCALLSCTLETGRTHQIRTHLTSMGFPLIGDQQYGTSPLHRLKNLPGPVKQQLSQLHRQALHAQELGFIHPVSQDYMKFSAPVPEDMSLLLDILRKFHPNHMLRN
ncbi:MAG: RluA family pseudouridine synthase [SAR324 cluster bacterium]|nr:RluA family pseudouridine synthase [SAR324 cluster bacterium]